MFTNASKTHKSQLINKKM